MPDELERDEYGNIVVNPVTGWATYPVAGTFALLAIQYAETPEELEKGASKSLQLGLTPHKALELAGALKRLAELLLRPPGPGQVRH